MDWRVNHIRTNMNAELADGPNSESIAQNAQGYHCKSQEGTVRPFLQKELPGYQAGDQEHQGRVDSTAFRCDLKLDSWQLKEQAVAQKGHTGHGEEHVGSKCRTMLKRDLDPVNQKIRKRNGKYE